MPTTQNETYPLVPFHSDHSPIHSNSRWKKVVFIALGTVLSIMLLFGLWLGWTIWDLNRPVTYPQGKIFLPDTYEPATFVSEETVTKIMPLIDQAKNLADLEQVINKEFMDKEYGKVGKDKRDAKIFLSKDTTNQEIMKSNLKENDIYKYKFDYPEAKDLEKTKTAVKMFIGEITKYPKEFSGFAFEFYFVFVKNIVTPNGEASGFYGDFVYFDINQIVTDTEFGRGTINHEFAHQLDHAGYLNLEVDMTNIDSQTGNDSTWASFNDPKFQYSKQPFIEDGIFHPSQGFVTNYSKSNTLEDKAEVLSYLMTKYTNQSLISTLDSDPILERKVNYLIDSLDEKAPGFKKVVNERANLR